MSGENYRWFLREELSIELDKINQDLVCCIGVERGLAGRGDLAAVCIVRAVSSALFASNREGRKTAAKPGGPSRGCAPRRAAPVPMRDVPQLGSLE
ncbi:unnamed protein product [Parnassius apollo]|uniref:(apollo) hypothetical protein n=1 Tax=Parnassius apollo TaxID=110799 RepID=A0A8S3WSX2_PARAO|nr:unnamed protein product [Parnassius apollo]